MQVCWLLDIKTYDPINKNPKFDFFLSQSSTGKNNIKFSPRMPGKLYNGSLYLFGAGVDSEIYNFATNSWSQMSNQAIPVNTADGPCVVIWRDSFLVFGGGSSVKKVQTFNITTKVNWLKFLHCVKNVFC